MNVDPLRSIELGDFPQVVLLDTVSFCNLRCSMCFHSEMTRKKGFMDWGLFVKCIDEIAAEKPDARVWLVFFGEPLVRRRYKPTIFDMIRYAKKKGLRDVVLNSNANLLDEATASALIDAGLDAIYVGIDAFSRETYDKVRVGGDYDKTVRNVLGLLSLKTRRGTANPNVFVQFVEMDVNVAEKEAFIRFWSDAGATVKIRPKVSWAGKIDAPNLTLTHDARTPCYWAMQTMSITDRGEVVTCAVDLDAAFVAGDVRKASLKEVWNTTLKALRQHHLDGTFGELPTHCRDCKDWQAASATFYV